VRIHVKRTTDYAPEPATKNAAKTQFLFVAPALADTLSLPTDRGYQMSRRAFLLALGAGALAWRTEAH
jgi:hypothetical protein